MSIVVTGSIAYDYLMSFPGKFTEHLLPEHVQRVSLSFLVDTMDKRRGGCAPNIAYTLALLGERPRLMATAGQDFGDYRRWLDQAGVDTSLVKEVPGKFTASFFCSTDTENNQIASFYTGAMANAGELSFRTAGHVRAGDHLAQRSGRDAAVRRGVPHAGESPTSSIRANRSRGCRVPSWPSGLAGARVVICNDYEFEIIRQKTGPRRGGRARPGGAAGHHEGRARLFADLAGDSQVDVPAVPPMRIVDPTGVGDAFRGGFMKGLVAGADLSDVRPAGERRRHLRARASRRLEPRLHLRRVRRPLPAALRAPDSADLRPETTRD